MRLKGPALQSADLEQLQPMQDQNAMLDACEAGDVPKLQRLFKKAGVRTGDAAFEPFFGEPVPATGPPPTCTMVTAAIAHKQNTIITCLLATYRNVNFDRDNVLEAVLANPHIPTLEILHSHTPSIINYEFRESQTTLLMEACRTSNPFLPTSLLRLGANPSECDHAGNGPLWYAVKFAQPFEVVVQIVEHGAIITGNVIQVAIHRRSLDVLKYLLERGRLEHPKDILEQAQGTDNKEVVTLIWERSKKGAKSPLKRRKRKGLSTFQFEERGESKWWQVGR